jgi:GWxTD domain-containing protein
VDGPAAEPEPSVRFARPLEIYRELDLITGSADFPAVATLTSIAGPADSTLLLFGLSLPTSALRFQRDEEGFAAHYMVSLRAVRDGQRAAQVDRRETVSVPDFAQTGRTDESVVFQTAVTLDPGEYIVSVRVRDGLSARGFEATDTVAVPRYGPDGQILAPPVITYRATPRAGRSEEPDLILNPRHTAQYGAETPIAYVETYSNDPMVLELRDVRGEPVWTSRLALARGDGFASGVVSIPVDSLPMGRLWMVAAAGDVTTKPSPLLVTLSDQWVVANFDEALELIRYIAARDELDAMAEASPEARRRLWDRFWEVRDPVPATPANEYRDAFFERVRTAAAQFGESGRAGWRTDRGEVHIVLGAPDRVLERAFGEGYGPDRTHGWEWVYDRAPGGGGLRLVFVDRTGFGVYRLTPASEAAFRAVAGRVRGGSDQ